MKFRIFMLIFCVFAAGCNKPNPNPEHLDPIYAELEKEKKDMESAISAESKQLAEFKEALAAVKPQTGQIKYAEKRYYESLAKVEKMKQMLSYLEIHIESRKKSAKRAYLKAFYKKEPWPDPKEYETYKAQKQLEAAPRAWDAKARIEKMKAPVKAAAPSEHH